MLSMYHRLLVSKVATNLNKGLKCQAVEWTFGAIVTAVLVLAFDFHFTEGFFTYIYFLMELNNSGVANESY